MPFRHHRKSSLDFCLAILVVLTIFMPRALAETSNIRFESIDIDEGLSQQSVLSIFQDSKGYMWFGTQEGLNRYDGISYTIYKPEINNPDSISDAWIKSIAEDELGYLWIATENGMNRFDPSSEKFTRFIPNHHNVGLNHKAINAVISARNNTIWVATQKGLNKYLHEEQRFMPFNFLTGDGDSVNVLAMAEDIAGNLWLGTSKYGLAKFDTQTEQLIFVDSHINDVRGDKHSLIKSLFIDDEQVLWIGTHHFGLYTLDLKQPVKQDESPTIKLESLVNNESLNTITKDVQGRPWVGTEKGLYYQNQLSGKFVKHLQAIENAKFDNNKIWSLYPDDGGVLWLGSFVGLMKWNTRTTQFEHYFKDALQGGELSDNNITAIAVSLQNEMYVGNFESVDIVSLDTNTTKQLPIKRPGSQFDDGLQASDVMSILWVSDEEVWFGHQTDGVTKYNPKTKQYKYYRHDPDDPSTIGEMGITAIIKAQDGTIWFGTYGGGLSQYVSKTDSFVRYTHDPADISTLSDNRVIVLHEDKEGRIWIGTVAGLNVLVPKTGTVFRIQQDESSVSSLASNFIWSILPDSDDNVWVGTQGGGLNLLSHINIESGRIEFEKFHTGNILPSDVVYSILEDEAGFLWLTTNKGMVKLNRRTKQALIYTKEHGLQENEFNSGSYFKDHNGFMYFGGINGITRFHPSNIQANPVEPNIEFTNFQRLNNVSSIASQLNDKEQLEVAYTDYLIGIEFAALDYTAPAKNRYKYKLENFDQDWIEVRDVKRASYTNLPSGKYTFKVMASNSDDVWNKKGKSIQLIVHPAPWFSWWAYIIYFFLVMVFVRWVLLHYKRKENAQTRYQKRLEQEVNERTTELQELNEQLFQASITDQMTGLHNRRYLDEHIGEKLENILYDFSESILDDTMSCVSGPRLMALMFDLDGFKPINDNYGHEAGDKVIKQVASILKEQCTNEDIVVRWGGDEYLIVARVNDLNHAQQVAENIRLSIADYQFDIGLARRFSLSASLGFALYPFTHRAPHSVSWDQVHLLADHALYKSKEAGRNTWSGIVEADHELPFSKLNTLVPNLESTIENGDVKVIIR
ncbi:two-component regulator propeller domain-containing protein [Glaciecola sp. 2405UD65-10]|uniref:ligand-binding sensor domain-containing diguanylate cyclase n=1 Tax=Glaciecola sp. 2405UD65-10 TaxID=3397244 RepID=UPI003B5C457D